MSSHKFYCRVCFTNSERFLRPINKQVQESFHSLTNIFLLKSDVYSNLICGKCDKKISDTRKYCDELKSNELQLMGKLDEIIFEESRDQNPLEDNQLAFEIKHEAEEEISEFQIAYEIDDPADEVAKELIEEIFGESSRKISHTKNRKKIPLPKRIRPPQAKEPSKTRITRQPIHKNPELDKVIENLPESEDGKVICPHCSQACLKIYIRQHIERVHLNIKNFTCDRCGRQFYLFSSLDDHMNQHLAIRPFACPKNCGQFFANKTSRKKHLSVVHNKNSEYVCEHCALKFDARHKLRDHILVKHEGHRWKCPYPNCNHEYQVERSLSTHIEDKHEIRTEPCPTCGKILRAGNQMFRHKQRNHLEKTQQCNECGKKFRFQPDLLKHQKIHEGQKDFVCHVCGNKYFTKFYLQRHIRQIHMKQKYFCAIPNCSAALINRDIYRVHIKKVHKDLAPDEMQEWIDKVTKQSPHFEVSEDQIGCIEDEEPPRRRKEKSKKKKV